MLLVALLGCPQEPGEPAKEWIEVRAFRWSWDAQTEPVGAAIVGLDDADGTRHLMETDNSGVVEFEVNPDDGPFTVTVLSYDNWPHAMTRMGITAEDSPVEMAFSAKEWELPTVMLHGRAEPRTDDTRLYVSAHQPDLYSAVDTAGDRWGLGVLPGEDVALLTFEYQEHSFGRHEYTRDMLGWYRASHDAVTEDEGMALDLTKKVQSHRAGGKMWTDEAFVGPLATAGVRVFSESSAWHSACGFETLMARNDRNGWWWAVEWAPPTLTEEEMLTQVWASSPAGTTAAVRHTTPDMLGPMDLLPAPVLDPELSVPSDFHFEAVPEHARPVLYIVPTDANSYALWMIEGEYGADRVVLPEPMDADLLPDIALDASPAMIRRYAEDPWADYDMAWGPAIGM